MVIEHTRRRGRGECCQSEICNRGIYNLNRQTGNRRIWNLSGIDNLSGIGESEIYRVATLRGSIGRARASCTTSQRRPWHTCSISRG